MRYAKLCTPGFNIFSTFCRCAIVMNVSLYIRKNIAKGIKWLANFNRKHMGYIHKLVIKIALVFKFFDAAVAIKSKLYLNIFFF